MLRIRAIRTTGALRQRHSGGIVNFDESQGGLARVPEPVAQELAAEGRVTYPSPEELCIGRFLVRRRVGLGDVLCLSATLREVLRLGGQCRVVTHRNYQGIFDGWIEDGKVTWQGRERVVMFDGWLDRHPGRYRRPAAMCFGDYWNLEIADTRPRMALTDEERTWGQEQVATLRGKAERAVAVFLKAGWTTRTYRGMPRVARGLAAEGVAILGFGDEVLPCCKRPPQVNVRQLAAMVAACDLVVSGDTGPMHLAAAVETPSVAVFCASSGAGSVGPGYDTTALEPEGLKCWPCWHADCSEGDLEVPGSCVQAVTPERVVQAALARLRSPQADTTQTEVNHDERLLR